MSDFPSHPYPWQLLLWQQLSQQRQLDRLPHALLLSGPKGLGKAHFAKAFAQLLLCSSPKETLACGQCRSCLLNRAGNHPDLIELAPEENSRVIKVDAVRETIEQLNKTSQQGGYKVLILNPAEAMNINAANALLKSLEEPAARTLLLLVSHSPSSVLPTIRSRCQLRTLTLPGHDQVVAWLQPLVPKETNLESLLLLADGSPLRALGLLEGDALEKRQQWKKQWTYLTLAQSTAVDVANLWQKEDLLELVDWVLMILLHLARFQAAGDKGLLSDFSVDWLTQAQAAPNAHLHRYIEKWLVAKRQLESAHNPNKQLLLEELLMDWVALLRAGARTDARAGARKNAPISVD